MVTACFSSEKAPLPDFSKQLCYNCSTIGDVISTDRKKTKLKDDKMLAKLKKVKFNSEGKNPVYKAILECPEGKELYIHFDYSLTKKNYWPLEVSYNGVHQGTKLAWYTRDIEKTTVDKFLKKIALVMNKKYGYELKQ